MLIGWSVGLGVGVAVGVAVDVGEVVAVAVADGLGVAVRISGELAAPSWLGSGWASFSGLSEQAVAITRGISKKNQ